MAYIYTKQCCCTLEAHIQRVSKHEVEEATAVTASSPSSIILPLCPSAFLYVRFFFVPLKFSLMFYSCRSLLILMVFREREGENTYTHIHMCNIQELYTQIIRIVLVNPVIVLAMNMCKCETRC